MHVKTLLDGETPVFPSPWFTLNSLNGKNKLDQPSHIYKNKGLVISNKTFSWWII